MGITYSEAVEAIGTNHKIVTKQGGFIGKIVAVDVNLAGTYLKNNAGCTIRLRNFDALDSRKYKEHSVCLSEIEFYHGNEERRISRKLKVHKKKSSK